MAVIDRTDRFFPSFGIRGWLERKAAERRVARAKLAEYFRVQRELTQLSNRDLEDIGISRADISDVAYEAAFK